MTEETNASELARMRDVPRDIQPYCIGLLRRGERWNDTQGAEAADLSRRHLAFLREQLEAGRYVTAGPVLDDESLAGMIIISAETVQEAMAIASKDPAIKTGRLTVEVHSVLLPSLQGFKVRF